MQRYILNVEFISFILYCPQQFLLHLVSNLISSYYLCILNFILKMTTKLVVWFINHCHVTFNSFFCFLCFCWDQNILNHLSPHKALLYSTFTGTAQTHVQCEIVNNSLGLSGDRPWHRVVALLQTYRFFSLTWITILM